MTPSFFAHLAKAACFIKKGRLPRLDCKRGQATVEYLLLLAAVSAVIIAGGILFSKKILGAFFTIIGLVLGGPT